VEVRRRGDSYYLHSLEPPAEDPEFAPGFDALAYLVDRAHARGIEVPPQPCPGLADLIEEGHLDDEHLHALLERLTKPLRQASVDTVVLGCTHYAFVSGALGRVLGPDVRLVDSAPAIARRTEHLLRDDAAARTNGPGAFRVLTTGDPGKVAPVVARLWGADVPVAPIQI